MSKFRFELLHPLSILERWEELLPHINLVVKVSNDEFTADTIKQRALNNNGLMIAILKDEVVVAVTTAEVVTYDSGLRSLLIPIFGGAGLFEWGLEWLELHKKIAKQLNCTELRGLAVRSGWMEILKDYGWSENHVVITMQLGDE
jgi:hypothetical protein